MGGFLGLVTLAWRDLWRNRRRTLLVGMAMLFCGFAMVPFIALGDGGHDQMIRAATDSFIAHIQIQDSRYQDDPQLDNRLSVAEVLAVQEVLADIPQIKGTSPRLVTGGLLSKQLPPAEHDDLISYQALTSEGVLLVGVDPRTEVQVSNLPQSVVISEDSEARFLLPRDPTGDDLHRGEAVLGVELARMLDVNVGDHVALTTSTSQGRTYGAIYRVAGLVRTGATELNRTLVLTDIRKLSRGLDAPDCATSIAVKLAVADEVVGVAAEVTHRLAGVNRSEAAASGAEGAITALSFKDLVPELDIFIKLDQASLLIMLLLLTMVVGAVIANVVTMSVMERTREFGVRLALGERPGRIAVSLVVEAGLLAFLATFIGALIGLGLTMWLQTTGVDLGMGEIEAAGVIIDAVYHPVPTLYGFLFPLVCVLGFTLMGAGLAALRMRRLSPVQALRFE